MKIPLRQMALVMPEKAVSAHKIIEQINSRHRRRKKAIISKAKMQAQRLGNFPRAGKSMCQSRIKKKLEDKK